MRHLHLPLALKCLIVGITCLVLGRYARGQATVTNIIRGDIAYPGERDTYSFSVTGQKRFYFDALTNVSPLVWSIAGPPGVIVTNRSFTSTDAYNGNPLLVLPSGNYTLTIEASGGATNAYAFRLVDLAEATLLTPGSTVTNGAFLSKRTDFYQFTAAAGDQFTFTNTIASGALYWRLVGPYNNYFFQQGFSTVGKTTLPDAGTYVLFVESDISNTGTNLYSFVVNPVGSAPRLFSGTPLSFGTNYYGGLTPAGTTNAYTFSVAQPTWVFLDVLTNQPGPMRMVLGPGGTVVGNGSYFNDWGVGQNVFFAPAGDYQMNVTGGAYTGGYAFRLFNLSAAESITFDTIVSGTNQPAACSRVYKIGLTAGQKVFFDALTQSGFNYQGIPSWKLLDPYGNVLFETSFNDQGPYVIGATGNYTLLVSGNDYEPGPSGTFSFRVVSVVDGAQSMALNTTVSGAITQPGQVQTYTFTLPAPTTVSFDSISNVSNVRWSLSGPTGTVAANNMNSAGWFLYSLPAGDYSLAVDASSGVTNGYAFRLLDLASATLFATDSTVNGSVVPTASSTASSTAYKFAATAGQAFYFKANSQSGFNNYGAYWTLLAPSGVQLFDANFGDQGLRTLSESGIYTILAGGYASYETTPSGSFSFTVSSVTNASLPMALNTTVAGALTQPGQVRTYTFTLPAPTTVSFDSISNVANVRWTLQGPNGVVANTVGMNVAGWLIYTLPAGDYTMTIDATSGATPGYAFRLLDFAAATPVAVDVIVSTNILPTTTTAYKFTATAGQSLYFNAVSQSGFNSYGAYWTLVSPSGLPLFDTSFTDRGPLTMAESGTYTMLAGGYGSYETSPSGSFSLSVSGVTNATQSINLGDTVVDSIAHPGQARTYTFNVPADTRISFDTLTNRSGLLWTLTGPLGVIANNVSFASEGWFVYPVSAGSYSLTVSGNGGSATGGFKFRILDLSLGTTIPPVTTINGNTTPVAATTVYKFTANVGQRLFLDSISQSGYLYYGVPFWRLYTPSGVDLFDTSMGDRGPYTLTESGTYTLLVQGNINKPAASGIFSFRYVFAPDTVQPLTLNTLVSGTLGVPAQRQRYTFTLPTPAKLAFDSWTNSTFQWNLTGPLGTVVSTRAFNGSDAQHFGGGNPVLNLPAGAYEMAVTAQNDAVGDYQFVLLDLAAATPLTLNSATPVGLSPAWSSTAYRFNAAAGDRIRLDGKTLSGAPNAIWRLIDPVGDQLWYSGFNNSSLSNLLSRGGTYTVLLEGYLFDSVNGSLYITNTTFPNIPPPALTGTPVTLGQAYTNVLATSTTTNSFLVHAASPMALYIDALNSLSLVYSVIGTNGPVAIAVNMNSGQFDSHPWVDLPAGDFEVQFWGAAQTMQVQFLDVLSSPVLAVNTGVTNLIVPSSGSVLYRVTQPAGTTLFYDGRLDSGFNAGRQVRLYSLQGGLVWGMGSPSSGFGPFTLSSNQTHFFALEGAWNNITATGSIGFAMQMPVQNTNALALGVTVQGTFDGGGDVDTYTFTLGSKARVFFDSLTNSYWTWSLSGSNTTYATSRDARFSDSSFVADASFVLPPGNYTFRAESQSTLPTGYSFRLLDATTAALTGIGTTNSTNILFGTGTSLYRFSGATGQSIQFRTVASTGFNQQPYSRLYSPSGQIIQQFSPTGDQPTLVLPASGEYTFAIEGYSYYNNSLTGFVSFVYLPVTYTTNALAIGATVQGTLDGGGDIDYYAFTLAGTNRLFFDSLTNTYWTWALTGPNGPVTGERDARFSDTFWVTDSSLVLTPGSYLFRAISQSTAPTPYAFRFLDAALAANTTLGATNSTNVLGGNGSVFYRFNATAGQQVYFRWLQSSGFNYSPYSRLYSPAGNIVQQFSLSADQDTFTLPATGSYLFAIEGNAYYNSTTGFVSFAYQPITHLTNALSLDTVVTNQITQPGTRHFYTFTLGAPTRVLFNALAGSTATWTLTRGGNVVVNGLNFRDSNFYTDSMLLLPAGDYLLTVGQPVGVTGGYSFKVFTPAGAQSIVYNTPVTNLVTSIAESRFYKFEGVAGDRLYFDGLGVLSGGGQPPNVRMKSPLDTTLLNLSIQSDRDTFALPVTGTYFLSAEGFFNAGQISTQSSAFVFWSNAAKAPAALLETNTSPDLVVVGVSVTPGSGVQSGQGITVNWTVQNSGGAPTASSFTDRVTVRNTANNQILVNSTVLYDQSQPANGPIAAAGQRTRQLAVTLPDGTNSVGTLEVTVTTDTLNNFLEQNGAGTGEANNASAVQFSSTIAPYPDLRISDLSVLPSSGWVPGSQVTVTWAVTNTGNRFTSNSWSDRVILRNLTTAQTLFTSNALYDAAAPLNGPIGPGESRVRQATFTLPNNSQVYGAFEISAEADVLAEVFEYAAGFNAETNNLRLINTLSAPDLLIAGLTVTPSPGPFSGALLTIQWRLTNSGTARAENGFYESVQVRNINTGQVLANQNPYYGSGHLTNGFGATRSTTVQLPDGLASVGTIEVTVSADAFNYLTEANLSGTGEANNGAVASLVTSLNEYPDLRITNITVAPASIASGTNLTISWTTTNSGTAPSFGSFYDQVVVVNTNTGVTLANASVYYDAAGSKPITNGTARSRSYNFTLPNNANGAGGLLITVTADIFNNVFEYNPGNTGESNNVATLSISSGLTPLPDLAVAYISAPPTARPGVPFTVTWGLTNIGTAATVGTWNDTIYLSSDTIIGFDVFLGSRQVTNTIPAGGFLVVTQTVTLPPASDSGPVYLVVQTDSNGSLNEILDNNNTFISPTSVIVPGALTMTLSQSQIAENAVNPNVSATVTRNGSKIADLLVSLSSSDTTEATVPSSVLIPAGQASATFFVTAQSDLEFDGPQVAQIVASSVGYDPATNSLTVLDSNQRRVTLTLSSSNVVEGGFVTATLTRDPITATNLTVQLLSSDPNQVGVPASIVILAGVGTTNFVVTPVDDSLIEKTNTYTITASATDHLSSSAILSVEDNDIPNVTLALASHSVSEGAGPNATSGTVTRSSTGPRAVVIALFSSNPSAAQVPASVTIPAGALSASFPVSAVNNVLVDGPKPLTIIGYITDSVNGTQLRATTPDLLTVTDDDGPTLTLAILADLVPEGRSPATTATVTRNTPTTDALVVNLTSDKLTEATVPPSVVIPAGTNSATFNIASVLDGVTDGNQTVTITAAAAGFTSGSDTLVVSDADLPDIVVTDLTIATNGYTAQNFVVSYTLGNAGLRGVNTNITQRIYISNDPLVGSDTLGAQLSYNGPLNVGDSIVQQATVLMPAAPGTYWIIVEADALNVVNEALENNNTRISAIPVVVGPAYSATVSTAVTVAKANDTIPMAGQAVSAANGLPATFVPVTIHVEVRGTRRTFTALTDGSGNFTFDFHPLPNEAGLYRILAAHPGVVNPTTWQDQFSILGFTIDNPGTVTVVEGGSNSVTTLVRNLSDQPLTGLQVSVYTNHASIHVDAVLATNTLAGNAQVSLRLDVAALNTSATYSTVGVRVITSEGVTNYLVFAVNQSLLLPALSATPGSLQTTMRLGRQTAVTFVITNGGGRATGPLQILIPSLPWLGLSSPQSLPPLAPGTNATVTLLLTPPVELPLGDYTGTIAINATNAALAVPYRFRTVSDGLGNLTVTAEDEYTYFTEGSPRVTNALVRITDALSGIPVATNRTGSDGLALFTNLTEAYYIVDVGADAHSSYRVSTLVTAGQTTNVVAFLQRQTVNYTFTVVPTTVEDRYQFQITSTFETQVPVPVVTISPASIDLAPYPGTDFQIEYKIANHGLIKADNIRLNFPSNSHFQITPLITEIGTLGPNQSITIPAKVHRGPPIAQSGLRAQTGHDGTGCAVTAAMLWNYLCGPNVVDRSTASYAFDSAGCDLPALYNSVYQLVPEGSPAAGTGVGPGGSLGAGGAPVIPADAGSNFAPPPGFVGVCRPAPLNIIPPQGGGRALSDIRQTDASTGVCARVSLKLNQSAVLTRDAFNATLEIGNDTANPLSEVLVTLQIQTTGTTNATALFAIREPSLVGLTGVGGSGNLSAFTTGSSSWILVPTLDAAPTNGARVFLVGGTMSYVQSGTRVTIPLAPAPIQVFPQPELVVRYFHDRDVFADDPFTPEVEPSLPYSLAVQVQNVGYGEARNLKITGGKPQVVDNLKGLLIDFKILGAQLENQSISPGLDVDFGSIGVASNKIARWLFTSTVQGSFTNYSASFQHLDAMNGKRLSLVRSTEIHELTKIVNVDGLFADGRPDMLVNDVADPGFLPDTLYLSQGPVRPVLAVTNATIGNAITAGQLQAQITASMPTGWVYLRIGNPGGTNFTLKQVLRPNGTDLGVGTNAWITDRFFRGGELRPIRTNLLHLLDYNSGGTYTLVYTVATNASDITPPTSQMTALPPVSPRDFNVTWSGSDDITGVAYYDLYASTNGGPFGLAAARQTSGGTVFHGQPGASYSFFTVATDSAGNSEAPAVTPKAQTTVTTAVNLPPVISGFSNRSINEGDVFTATPTATDPDGASQILSFSLVSGPAGALVNSTDGSVYWPTTESQGGQVYPFKVAVTDNGLPSLSATQSFSITVVEVNNAPVITSSPVINVNEDTALSAVLTATDTDLPAQLLTWQIVFGAPPGMILNSAGLLLWTPSEADGPTNRIVTVRVSDNGSPSLSVTQVVNVIVAEVNRAPQIAAVSPKFAGVGQLLTFTNTATDPDLPANRLTFSLGAGAPRGARINPTNGAFAWTPTPDFASTTNTITVRVTDDGLPALVATTSFTVGIGDFLGVEIGSAIVLTNEAASLPIRVTGTAVAQSLTVVVQAGAPVMTQIGLSDGGSGIFQSGWLDEVGTNTYKIYLQNPLGVTGSTNVAARITFKTTNGIPSAIVPIKVLSVTAQRLNGQPVGETGGSDGRLVFINREPIMELLRLPAQDGVKLYGRPGIGYEVQFSTDLAGGTWSRVSRIPLTNRFTQFAVVVTNGSGFYRTLELGQPKPLIDLLSHSPATLKFMLYGEPGANYDIETKTAVANAWAFQQNVPLTAGYREVSLVPPSTGIILIRAVKK